MERIEVHELLERWDGLQRLGLPAHRVAMLGDQVETDLAGARAAGVVPVLLGTGVTEPGKARVHLRQGEFFLPALTS